MMRSMKSEPNFRRAVQAAYRMRDKYSTERAMFDPFLPISVEKNLAVCKYSTFCELHGLDVLDFLRYVSTDGFTLRRNGRYIIVYNDSPRIGAARRRFTLAHELGHYALRHSEEGNEVEEKEADCFARNLLAPRLVALAHGWAFTDYPRAFGVSAAAARMCERYRELDEKYGVQPIK